MEYAIIGFCIGLICWFLFRKPSTKESKSGIIKIDDKNWIVNNERISFEEDTPLLKHRQEMEDRKHYRNYERAIILYDRNRVYEEWNKTTQFIYKHPDWIEEKKATAEELKKIIEKYQQYLKMCTKLEENCFVLTKEQFIIKETNIIFCCSLKMMLLTNIGCYTIHNEKTAKYMDGNMQEQIKKEFTEKWY